jgi:hypothetical protein
MRIEDSLGAKARFGGLNGPPKRNRRPPLQKKTP